MKVLVLLAAFAGIAWARPQVLQKIADAASAVITKYNMDNNELGEYSYEVETSDGLIRGERRKVMNPGTDQEKAVVEGYYSYLDPNGERKTVGYQADEQGFQAEGEHLPDSANARRKPPKLGIPSSAISTLGGGGLGR